MSAAAYWYLLRSTSRNRWRVRLKRLRNPRYLLGLALVGAYIWFFFLRNDAIAMSGFSAILGETGRTLAVAGVFLMTVSSWLFGGDRMALAFSQAEVAFLFPAPLSRRQLVTYKLVGAQLGILVSTLIWSFFLRRGGEVPPLLRGLGLYVLFTTLNLHRLVAAMVRSSLSEHRVHGARRHRPSIVIFVGILAVVVVGVAMDFSAIRDATSFTGRIRAVGDAFATAPASLVLWPYAAVLAPVFAKSTTAWLAAFPAAAAVVLAHALWVMRTDAAFEEAALAASAERVEIIKRFREGRGWYRRKPVATAAAVPIRLAARGHPAIAIIWKNAICLRRTFRVQDMLPLLFAAIPAAMMPMMMSDGESSIATGIAASCGMMAMMLLIFGARILRNDLRQDMQHLVALKTLPLRGHAIVAAEVLSAAVPIAALQVVLLTIAALAMLFIPESGERPGDIAVAWVVAMPVLLAFNVAMVTIQNAAPVLFPSWTRLGTAVNPGIETMGQNLVATGLVLVLVLLMLLVPGGVGIALGFALHHFLGLTAAAVLIAVIVGSALLGVEAYLAMLVFGRAFEKTEPMQIT
jgi:ABC-2 type transport system permease protein